MKKQLFLFIFFLFFLLPSSSLAQEFSLSLTPPVVHLIARPGKKIIQTYELENPTPNTIYLTTSILPFEPADDQGNPQYQINPPSPLTPQPQFSLQNTNLSLGENFALSANQKQQLVLKISLPENLPETDYYYTLFIEKVPSQANGQSQTAIQPRLGSHLLISASSSVDFPASLLPSLEIKNGLWGLPIFDLFLGQPQILIKLQNPNSHLAYAQADLTLLRHGQIKQTQTLRPDRVLAGSIRQASCTSQDNCHFSPPFWPGRYQVKLSLPDQELIQSFYTLPYYLLGLCLLGLLLFFFIKLPFLSRIKK